MGLSRVEVRAALIQKVQDNTGPLGMPVYHENRDQPDLDKVKPVFLHVGLDFTEAVRADVNVLAYNTGLLVLTLYTRVGEGVVVELSAADHLDVSLSRQLVQGISLGVMTPGRKTPSKTGWRCTEWLIPFSYYS